MEFFFKAANEHSLHSPFLYGFYTNLKSFIRENAGQEEIEKIRREFLKDKTPVSGMDYGAGTRVGLPRTVSAIARHGISTSKDCLMLAHLVRYFHPETIIELGTSLGIATAYLANACDGTVYTFEGNEDLLRRAKQVSDRLSMKNTRFFHGNIDDTLPEALHGIDRVDLAVIDANHRGDALQRYFRWLREKMSDKSLIVVDDIRWSAGMYKAWQEITGNDCVAVSIDFYRKGLLFFDRGLQQGHFFLSL